MKHNSGHAADLTPGAIAVLGIPFDANSSFLRGPSLAPPEIREALFSKSSNLWTENGIDLGNTEGWQLVGDVDFSNSSEALEEIELSIAELLEKDARVISLGGDHSITYPILRSYAKAYPDITIFQFDAHPDLYEELDGNRYSHACPFARIMEESLAARLVQIGIRTMTGHQLTQADRYGVEVIEMRNIHEADNLEFDGPLYLSVDLDCLDPAFAPGVSHFEPGGLSTRELLQMIQNVRGNIIGADIVEYNPERDPQGITSMVAAKLLKEIISKML
jgi:agmatinase